jgi:hypothetical protein
MKCGSQRNIGEACAKNMRVHRFNISICILCFDEHLLTLSYVRTYLFDLSVSRPATFRCLLLANHSQNLQAMSAKGAKAPLKRKFSCDHLRADEIDGQQDHCS